MKRKNAEFKNPAVIIVEMLFTCGKNLTGLKRSLSSVRGSCGPVPGSRPCPVGRPIEEAGRGPGVSCHPRGGTGGLRALDRAIQQFEDL